MGKTGEALLEAARHGKVDQIRELLEADPAVGSYRNESGQSAVLLAKYHRQQEAVALLLDLGVELNIYEAAAVGDGERVGQLIEEDRLRLNSFSQDGFSPLMLAAFFGNTDVAADLIAGGADVNATSKNPMRLRAIHLAAAGRNLEIVRRLVKAGADVNATQQQGFTPMHAAANNGDEEMVRFLLAHKADRNARSEGQQTALDIAMTEGHAGVAKLLGEDAH
ncbi:MAG: hypothetical protein GY953_28040 [bacterium]|nr:hypothetical protein [bacterium]